MGPNNEKTEPMKAMQMVIVLLTAVHFDVHCALAQEQECYHGIHTLAHSRARRSSIVRPSAVSERRAEPSEPTPSSARVVATVAARPSFASAMPSQPRGGRISPSCRNDARSSPPSVHTCTRPSLNLRAPQRY